MSPPCYVRGVLVLVEVRDGLVEVAPPQEAMRAAELLDLDLIKQQLDAGTWSWGSWRELMGSVMRLIQRVQSPARDDETQTRWAALQVSMDDAPADERSAVVVGGLEFMLNRVNALRIDAANAVDQGHEAGPLGPAHPRRMHQKPDRQDGVAVDVIDEDREALRLKPDQKSVADLLARRERDVSPDAVVVVERIAPTDGVERRAADRSIERDGARG
jgi:hypothetical protein